MPAPRRDGIEGQSARRAIRRRSRLILRPAGHSGRRRRNGVTKDGGRFLSLANATDGSPRFPHGLKSGDTAPDAVTLLRKVLAAQPDGSVVAIQTGFSTNLARLLDSNADDFSRFPASSLSAKKSGSSPSWPGHSRRSTAMRIIANSTSSRTSRRRKISPETGRLTNLERIRNRRGRAVPAREHRDGFRIREPPSAQGSVLSLPAPATDRPTWDATAVLAALLPDEKFFYESPEGIVTVEADGGTTFRETEGGPDRYLILQQSDAERVRAKIVELCTAKPPNNEQSLIFPIRENSPGPACPRGLRLRPEPAKAQGSEGRRGGFDISRSPTPTKRHARRIRNAGRDERFRSPLQLEKSPRLFRLITSFLEARRLAVHHVLRHGRIT